MSGGSGIKYNSDGVRVYESHDSCGLVLVFRISNIVAEFILPLGKSILANIASIGGGIAGTYTNDEIIKATLAAKNDLEIIKEKFTVICGVLEDAEEEQQYSNKAMQLWLKDLKNVAYDIDDLLDELAYDALPRSVNEGHLRLQARYHLSTSNPILTSFDLSHKIKALRERLEHVVSNKIDFNLNERLVETPRVQRNPLDCCDYLIKSAVIGRNEAKEDVLKRLVSLDDANALTVLPIVGIGGIGKTILARLVYNVIPNFDIKLWACVSEVFDIDKIIAEILQNPGDDNISKLAKLLQGKKYILVLDDVWIDSSAKWTEFENLIDVGKPGSVILITTRIQRVADITGTIAPYYLERLPDSICLSIFRQLVFIKDDEHKYPKLSEIGKCIVEKCHGVPLVVKTLGSLLQSERNEVKWLEIKNNDNNFMELCGEYDHVMKLLRRSYIKLPSHLKTYFAYLATLWKDTTYNVTYRVNIMRALGMTQISYSDSEKQRCEENAYMELLSKSMIQEAKMSFTGKIIKFKLQDLLHDVAVGELGEELSIVTKNEIQVSESTRHVSWHHEFKGSCGLSDNECEYSPEFFKAKKARTFTVATTGNHITRSFLEKIISNFTRLRILDLPGSLIDELPSSIGNLKHLRLLDLSRNPIKSLPDTICELLNLQTLYLLDCEQLEELPKRIHRLISLRCFYVTTRQSCLADTQFNELPCLQDMYIMSCNRLTTLWESDSIACLASVRYLCIGNCPRLARLPNSMKLLVSLEELSISKCQELDLEDGDGLSGLLNLRYLEIIEIPRMMRVPDGIQSASKSLEYLWIEKCGGLLELPNWLQSFASLRRLLIDDCPHLSKRCTIMSGEDYPFIQHVSEIWLDGRGHIFTQP